MPRAPLIAVPMLLTVLTVLAVLPACRPRSAERPPPPPVPVVTRPVERSAFVGRLRLLGEVRAAERVVVAATAAGVLAYPERWPRGPRAGERVAAGDVLFTVVSPVAEHEVATARLDERAAAAHLARVAAGVEGGFRSTADLESAEIDAERARGVRLEAERQLARLVHRAPIGGVVRQDAPLAAGAEVTAETPVVEVVGDDAAEVAAWAAPADLAHLEAGLAVELAPPAAGGRDPQPVATGRVAEIDRQLDEHGTATVVVEVTGGALPPLGSGIEVDVLLPADAPRLAVPEAALVWEGGVPSVYVVEVDGTVYRARRRWVALGLRGEDAAGDDAVAIEDGLRPGERVVVAGADLLADGVQAIEAEADDAEDDEKNDPERGE